MADFLTDEQMAELEGKNRPDGFISDTEMSAMERQEKPFSVYTSPAASKIAEAGKWALGRVGEASQFIDKYTMGPVRAAIGAVQEGRSLTEPYDYEKTPTWKDIAEKAGVSGEPSIQSPVVLNPFDPEANKLSPAGIVGTGLGVVTDPLTYLGTPGVGAGVKLGAEGAEQMLKSGARKAGEFAEERAAKAALGSNVRAYRDVARMPARGIPDTEKAVGRIRDLGRTMLEDKNVGWLSTTEDVGKQASQKLPMVGEILGEQAKIVDTLMPSGAVSGQAIADRILEFAANVPETGTGKALQNRLLEEAETFTRLGNMSVSDANRYKTSFGYKPQASDALISSQDATNSLYGIINSEIESAVDNASNMLKGMDDPIAQEASKRLDDFKKTKGQYGQYKAVAETATERAARDISNRAVSPSDYGMGAAGAVAGASMGGDVNSALLGAGLGVANKVARERGPAFLARSADEIRKVMESGSEALSKYKPVLEKAAMAGNQSLIVTHQTLMNNDPTYRQAVIQGLTSVQTEPFKSIGDAMDTAGMANVAMAGVTVPIMLFKGGNLLTAAKEMVRLNTGREEMDVVRKSFIKEAQKVHPDVSSDSLGAFFDKAASMDLSPKKGNAEKVFKDRLRKEYQKKWPNKVNFLGDSPKPQDLKTIERAESMGSSEPYIGRDISNPIYAKKLPPVGVAMQYPIDNYIPDGKLGRDLTHGGADPFAWMDTKYGYGKRALEAHAGKNLSINTRSDLIAHDDYMKLIDPRLHEVNFYMPNLNERAARAFAGGAPSQQRILKAAQKLREAGIKVTINLEDLPVSEKLKIKNDLEFRRQTESLKIPVYSSSSEISPEELKSIRGMLGEPIEE